MSKISFLSQKLFFSASVNFVSQCQPRHSVSITSVSVNLISQKSILSIVFGFADVNKKNRRMFCNNIVYVSFINVILMFVIHLKKQDFVWNMYKKTLMNKLINAVICDIKKKHDLFFLKYRSIEKFVNVIQFHKKILAKTIFWNWHLRLKHCRSEMINQFSKIDEIEVIQEKISKIVQCNTYAISNMYRLIQRTSLTKTIKIF
jgi:hypothetical protein